jgi:hypothetical protein
MIVAVTVSGTAGPGALHGTERLPATSAEVVGAAAGALVLLLWSIVRFRMPGLASRGSTDQAP